MNKTLFQFRLSFLLGQIVLRGNPLVTEDQMYDKH